MARLADGTHGEYIDEIFNKVDIGFVAGIRLYIIENLSLNTQFSSSIIPLNKIEFTNSQGQNIGTGNSSLRTFQLGISY
ncbi:MAG: hypothetical protein IPL08_07745 [Saprospiraceae bacterium]|nr:hypothetical protein [Saprospiraceae bacterium]